MYSTLYYFPPGRASNFTGNKLPSIFTVHSDFRDVQGDRRAPSFSLPPRVFPSKRVSVRESEFTSTGASSDLIRTQIRAASARQDLHFTGARFNPRRGGILTSVFASDGTGNSISSGPSAFQLSPRSPTDVLQLRRDATRRKTSRRVVDWNGSVESLLLAASRRLTESSRNRLS